MNKLVVFDSVFGNTARVAQAIGDALSVHGEVGVFHVSKVEPEHLKYLRTFFIGSPTRGFRPTRAMTTFLIELDAKSLAGVKVYAFDTRVDVTQLKSSPLTQMVKIFGYAAPSLAKRAVKRGGTIAVPPEGFFVKDSEGPLVDGELERATAWALSAIAQKS